MIVTLYTFKSPFILQILTKIKREEGKKRKEGVGKLYMDILELPVPFENSHIAIASLTPVYCAF